MDNCNAWWLRASTAPQKAFCKKTRSMHPSDAVQGFGISQQAFCNATVAVVYTAALLATTMKPFNVLPRFENHFAIKTVRFQVPLDAGGYFFAQEIFVFASAASRASRYQLAIFESDFTNLNSKTLVWLRPNPIFSKKLRWLCILSSKGIMIHKGAGTVQLSLFLPKFSSPFLATRRKWRIFKSSCWHSSILVVIYSNNLI